MNLLDMPLIEHVEDNEIIYQRVGDGYINATTLCKACGKEIKHYNSNSTTKEFLSELSRSVGIPTDQLIQVINSGPNELRGSWVHPQVAINLAQWASPRFAVLVTTWMNEWMQGKVPKQENIPYHLRRYLMNIDNVPYGHFSIMNEITFLLIAPMEKFGYRVSGKMVPDISLGKTFAKYLKDNGYPMETYPKYMHVYEDGREFESYAYPNKLLEEIRKFYFEDWLKNRSHKYFAERDKDALPYLEKILTLPNYRQMITGKL